MFKDDFKPFRLKTLKYDAPASLVVFLVALPLCLGIALASGAPPFAGIIAGIIGGIVIGTISGSALSVSGPAAGLTTIVLGGIATLGSFEAFLVAVVMAGAIQVLLGIARAGVVAWFFPHTVIKGMLAYIGIILLMKQLPHALGYDKDFEGNEDFFMANSENSFTEIIIAAQQANYGAILIAVVALGLLILWESKRIKQNPVLGFIPGPLLAVLSGVGINLFLGVVKPDWELTAIHLVSLPVTSSPSEWASLITFPDFTNAFTQPVIVTAVTIAAIASIETLLSIDAADKMDPFKRRTSGSRELIAQGIGNMTSGLIGGLPTTAVIVRSSANITTGARTKASAILHGVLLLLAVLAIPLALNYIPLAALAAVLLQVGYKLAKPSIFLKQFKLGWGQFIPFVITIVAMILTDLLIGIGIGMAVGLVFVIVTNYKRSIVVSEEDGKVVIVFNKDVSFLNKAYLIRKLEAIEPDSYVLIQRSDGIFVDPDIEEALADFCEKARHENIQVEYDKPEPKLENQAVS